MACSWQTVFNKERDQNDHKGTFEDGETYTAPDGCTLDGRVAIHRCGLAAGVLDGVHLAVQHRADRDAAFMQTAPRFVDRGLQEGIHQSRSRPFMPAFLRAFLASSVRILPAW